MKEIMNACSRCGNTELLRVHQFGWYFVKCHNCTNFNDSVISKTDPVRNKAIENWNNQVLDERFWQPPAKTVSKQLPEKAIMSKVNPFVFEEAYPDKDIQDYTAEEAYELGVSAGLDNPL